MMRPEDPAIVVEQQLNTSPETAWRALTERDEMVKWYFDSIPAFKAEVGFETAFDVDAGDRVFLHQWRISAVEPGRSVVVEWRFDGMKGLGMVRFDVLTGDEPGTCTVRVTNTIEESYPDLEQFKRESCEGGWKYFLQQRLKEHFNS